MTVAEEAAGVTLSATSSETFYTTTEKDYSAAADVAAVKSPVP